MIGEMKYYQHGKKILTVEDFLSKEECQEYIVLDEQVGYEMAKVNTVIVQQVVAQD
jgi:hypothetical protein